MDKNSYLIEISESPRTQFGKVPFSEQPEAQKVFSAIWELESEVNNGGFLQYLGNSSGETASYAAKALRKIGAPKMADITEKAIGKVFPDGVPNSDDDRVEIVDNVDEDAVEILEGCDDQFMSYPENLTDLLYDYVQKHPDDFGT